MWLALEERVVPFAEIPYVRELARHGLASIAESLSRGHRSQREANQASLELQDVFA